MKSAASFRGHGIHPIMVTVPLGAVPVALVFDALLVWTGDATWSLAGLVATGVAAVGIVFASIPGTVDLLRVVPREGDVWRRATSHMALGWVLGAYYLLFAFARWAALPVASRLVAWVILGVNALGFGLMLLQGYWGGELVARHRIGVLEGEESGAGERGRATERG